ncbi:MAG: Smg protein [Moritella dasanensis]|jgi:Smg protein
MLDVLIYLFENFYEQNESEFLVDRDNLLDELLEAGFAEAEILKAMTWIENLVEMRDGGVQTHLQVSSVSSMRIYTDAEQFYINTECRGFLLFLEHISVLNIETREMAIARLVELENTNLDLDDIKWVILMVLFNVPDGEEAYLQMEELVHAKEHNYLH